jgi:hypothetical protein
MTDFPGGDYDNWKTAEPDDTGAVPEREVDDEETKPQCLRCLRAVEDCVCCWRCDGRGTYTKRYTNSFGAECDGEGECSECEGTGREPT